MCRRARPPASIRWSRCATSKSWSCGPQAGRRAVVYRIVGQDRRGRFCDCRSERQPSQRRLQDNLTFTGTAFAPNESVRIYVSGVGSRVLASAMADTSGAFTVTARAPQSPYGPRLFLGVGQRSGKLGAASFWVTPRLILNPNSGPAGSTMAQGCGFRADGNGVHLLEERTDSSRDGQGERERHIHGERGIHVHGSGMRAAWCQQRLRDREGQPSPRQRLVYGRVTSPGGPGVRRKVPQAAT